MAVAVVVAALATGIALAPTLLGASAAPKVVGQVIVVGGRKKLTTKDSAGGFQRVRSKDDLVLDEQLVMGAGVTATLRLSRPKDVSSALDLITLKPVPGTPHKVLVSSEDGDTIVRIVPG